MSNLAQHLVVLFLAMLCVAWLAWGIVKTIRRQRGGIGKCCSHGCGTEQPLQTKSAPAIVFLPEDNLRKRRA